MKNVIIAMVAGVALVGCDPECSRKASPRVEALEASAWKSSEWISAEKSPVLDQEMRKRGRSADGTAAFGRRVENAKKVVGAKWMTAGLGVYELYVNGKPVGTDFLKPGFTHGKKTKYSYTYDVTALMKTGAGEQNDFGAEVGAGWWRDAVAGYPGVKSAFRGVLELAYADGTKELVGTKAAEWFGESAGPVTHSGIFDGEEYDARQTNVARTPREKFAPGGCVRNDEFKGEILPTAGAEIVLRCDLAMKKGPFTVRPGETLIVDFGQNAAAVPFFRFRAKAGTVLTALSGEMLNDADKGKRGSDGPKGSLYRQNLRNPQNGMRFVYTFAGADEETYLPRFTFCGYRYLSVTATDEVAIEEIASVPVSSVSKEMETGALETGDATLNRFIQNVYWGQLSNYLSVPTDCPQRNERQGWTADTQVFAETGSFNADMLAFFHKWMRDMRDTQRANGAWVSVAPEGRYGDAGAMRLGWQDAGVIVPYQMWKQFGDRTIIDENWDAMNRFIDHLSETKMDADAVDEECDHYQFADWLSFEDLESCSGKAFTWKDGKRFLKPAAKLYWSYLGACYWLWDAELLGAMARGTGRDPYKYDKIAQGARAYIDETFFKPNGGLLPSELKDLQTAMLFAVKLNLVTGTAREKTLAALTENVKKRNGCLSTGFLGTSILMDTLTENGLSDLAWNLLLNHDCPGWLYSVDQGATTVWERWNSYTKKDGFGDAGMNSFNHYAYGAVLAWIYKSVAGIAADPASPGFKNIVMAPKPDRRIGFVKASYRSAAGLVTSAWRYEGDKWIWDFTVPAGATASVTLPGETAVKAYPAGTYRIEKVLVQ